VYDSCAAGAGVNFAVAEFRAESPIREFRSEYNSCGGPSRSGSRDMQIMSLLLFLNLSNGFGPEAVARKMYLISGIDNILCHCYSVLKPWPVR
jgi:hypothetical protein